MNRFDTLVNMQCECSTSKLIKNQSAICFLSFAKSGLKIPRELQKNTTKKLAHVGVFLGHMLSQNHVPKVYDLGPLNNMVLKY